VPSDKGDQAPVWREERARLLDRRKTDHVCCGGGGPDPELTETRFRLSHPVRVPRPADEQEAREDLLHDRADLRQRQARTGARSHAFFLQKGIGDRGDHHVMLPAGVRPPFEGIELVLGSVRVSVDGKKRKLTLEYVLVPFSGTPTGKAGWNAFRFP
jgi:hypothetical protein